jgi:Putative Ig domain
MGPGPTVTTFSMTEVAEISLGANSAMEVDFEFMAIPGTLTLSCAPATTGTVGVPYSSGLMAIGGVPPYTFSIVTGMLPPGLSLNSSTGLISGTPTTAGTYSFTAEVTDSEGHTATSLSCSIVIASAPPPITLMCASSTGTVGVPYSSALVATGGVPPYTFSIIAGTLPPGLTLNASTGASGCTITVGTTPPPPVCPGATSTLISSLGSAGPSNFAVLSLGGAGSLVNINLATVTGNVGVPNTGTFQESSPSVVTGNIIVGSAVSQSGAQGSRGAFIVDDALLAAAVSAAQSAASMFASLASTSSVQSQFPANGNINGAHKPGAGCSERSKSFQLQFE